MPLPPLNPTVVKPQPQRAVRGEFKCETSGTAEALLKTRSKISSQSIVRGNNAVPPNYMPARNPVSRAHTLKVGDGVQARVATRTRDLRVVMRGEAGTVDEIYRSGRIHVLWGNGGSGWYTIAELVSRVRAGP
jgi:hypothetical protein